VTVSPASFLACPEHGGPDEPGPGGPLTVGIRCFRCDTRYLDGDAGWVEACDGSTFWSCPRCCTEIDKAAKLRGIPTLPAGRQPIQGRVRT
jgi:hypothetical protein